MTIANDRGVREMFYKINEKENLQFGVDQMGAMVKLSEKLFFNAGRFAII